MYSYKLNCLGKLILNMLCASKHILRGLPIKKDKRKTSHFFVQAPDLQKKDYVRYWNDCITPWREKKWKAETSRVISRYFLHRYISVGNTLQSSAFFY